MARQASGALAASVHRRTRVRLGYAAVIVLAPEV
jgi:hypothetical protein